MTSSSQRRSRRRPIVTHQRRQHAPPAVEPVRVRVEQHVGGVVLRVSGEFDLCAVERVERSFALAVEAETERVVFDLRGVSFLDVCGLNTLLRADARARRESVALGVVPPAGLAARIFEVTDAARELTLLEDP